MRPNQLIMTAFGPYKETEVIDFDALAPHNLFVISGATGSGKTTIFDGLCYALYGQASGIDRENFRTLRSDFADNDTPSRVELIFTVRHDQYRVVRQIPYLRVGNKTETPGSAELFKINADGDESEAVDRQNIRDVNEKIETLIGFTQDQFNQLVMLPQGEFRKFLTSNTENRETILRKIFNTEIYANLVDQLKIKRDDKKQSFETLMLHRDQLIHEIEQLPHRETPFFTSLNEGQINIHQASLGLVEEAQYYQEERTKIEAEHSALTEKEKKAKERYQQAEQINQQLNELESINQKLTELQKEQPKIDAIEKEIVQAEKAQPLSQKNIRLLELREEAKETALSLKSADVRAADATQCLKDAENNYREEEKRADKRELLLRDLIALEKQQAMIHLLNEKREREERLANICDVQNAKTQALNDAIIALKQSVDEQKREADRLNETSQDYDKKQHAREILGQHCQLMQKLENEKNNIIALEKEYRDHKIATDLAEKAADKMVQRWLHNQAAFLASQLIQDEACPVCGSLDHPKPMDDSQRTITEEEYNQAQKERNRAHDNYQRTKFKREEAEKNLAELMAEQKKLQITLNSTELQAELKALDRTIDTICECQDQLVGVNEILKATEAQIITKEAELAKESATLDQYRTQYLESNIELRQILTEIPEELREPKAFELALDQKRRDKEASDKAWKEAEHAYKVAENNLTEANTRHEALKEIYDQLVAQGKRLREQFDQLLKTQGFKNEREFRAAERPFDRLEALRQTRQSHHIAVESLANNRRDLELRLKDQTRQPLTALSEALTQLSEKISATISQQLTIKNYLTTIRNLQKRIKENAEALESAETEFGRLENIYNLIRGQNPLKLSFERYIQIEYLERVIETANLRLREVTNGQFEFIRNEEQASRGRQSGLDLDVYDAYTGQTRDVKTMSGGEKFKASLCLSLGMADVIQSFKGGISIDTLFIDEGFGSLDEESLQQAIDVLIDLQKSGRMIGVISHVEELKQVLPARIEVTKTKSGYSQTEIITR